MTPLHTRGTLFVDAHGRQVTLRGVNLGGDCKVPFPDGGTQHASDFADHGTVSFIGRPFPLSEADEHLGRLAHWGFNCVRLLMRLPCGTQTGSSRWYRWIASSDRSVGCTPCPACARLPGRNRGSTAQARWGG